MSSTPLRVLVIGGGIGGLCLAQGLRVAGVPVAVYERNLPNMWPEGYRIHINPVGSRALHACLPPALWQAFVESAGRPPAGLGFLTEQLVELVVIAEQFMANQAHDPVDNHYPINRIALRHILLAGLQDVVHFDKTFERYEQRPDGKVTAFFTDGTSATGDILVGADGANSRVRKQYLPHAQRVEIGAAGIGGKLLLDDRARAWLAEPLLRRMNIIMPPSRYALFCAPFDRSYAPTDGLGPIHHQAEAAGLDRKLLADTSQGYLLWAYIAPADTYGAAAAELDGAGLQHLVGELIEDWHPILRQVIAESDPQSVSLNPFKASAMVGAWPSTNITLLGDAIHNMPPVGGLGGNMALRDASRLASILAAVQRGELSLLPAIQGYEADMRAHGYAAVQAALSYTRQASSGNRIARELGKVWFRLCRRMPALKQVFEDRWTKCMRAQPHYS